MEYVNLFANTMSIGIVPKHVNEVLNMMKRRRRQTDTIHYTPWRDTESEKKCWAREGVWGANERETRKIVIFYILI